MLRTLFEIKFYFVSVLFKGLAFQYDCLSLEGGYETSKFNFFVTFKKFKKGSYISEFLKIKQKSF